MKRAPRKDQRYKDADSAPGIVSEKRTTLFLLESVHREVKAHAGMMQVLNAVAEGDVADDPLPENSSAVAREASQWPAQGRTRTSGSTPMPGTQTRTGRRFRRRVGQATWRTLWRTCRTPQHRFRSQVASIQTQGNLLPGGGAERDQSIGGPYARITLIPPRCVRVDDAAIPTLQLLDRVGD